jgi:hypothetical protein
MAHYRGTIASSRTAEATFEYMAHFANIVDWDPTAVAADQVDGEEPGPGARFEVLVRWLGREIPLTYETVVFEPPRRLVLRAENAGSISEDTVTVEPSPLGATLVYDAELRLKGALRLLDPLFSLAFRRLGDNAAAGLRRELG